MNRIIRTALLAVAAVAAQAAAAAERPLVPPFEPIHYLAAPSSAKRGCDPAPPPVKDLPGASTAAEATRSTAGEDERTRSEAALKSLHDLQALVADHGDRYFLSRGADRKAAACVLVLLDAWARQDALLGEAGAQGVHERDWALASLAMNALKIRRSPDLDRKALARVNAWLGRVAGKVVAHYADPKSPDGRSSQSYWAGLGVGLAAVAAQDRKLFDWAMQRYKAGVAQVQADGSLPAEMGRREKALQSHLFALAPLVMLAELGEWNGVAAYSMNDNALHRLVTFTTQGARTPKAFARRAGAGQDGVFPPRNGSAELAWVEAYASRFPERAPMDWVKPQRPIQARLLGGGVSYLYSAREGP